MPSFSSLGVPENLVRSLTERGITEPFPIQSASLPDTLAGRDVLGRGRTGSGKTLAFSLPMVARLAGGTRRPRRPRGLVLAPTRELATQIAATLEPLAASAGLTVTTIFGGVSQHRQEVALGAGVDIVVACPGRLEDLLGQKVLTLDDVEITVLDEADHMADLGFLPGVRRIMGATPARGQRLLFSATLDNGVDQIVQKFMHRPSTHSVDSAETPVAAMTHHVFTVSDAEVKAAVVRHLASGVGRRLLFTRTKHQAKKLAKQLTAAGIPAVDLHGNLSQNARERNLDAFSTGGVRVLVATDIAARGIHVDDVELVVHVDPPAEHKAYLHRSGRTARAGSGGDVVTLVLPEQTGDVRTLTRLAKIDARPQPVQAGARALEALVGEIAPVVVPTAPPVSISSGGGNGRSGRGRGRSTGSTGSAAGHGASGSAPAHPGQGRGGATAPKRVGLSGEATTSSGGRRRRSGSAGAGAAAGSGRSAQGRSAISQFPVQSSGSGGGRSTGGGARRDGAVEMSRSGGGRRRGR
ncbi:DEAD/DEAH box helicase [Actinotalea subterranea]|uniref:DEAD/DEAH box helicase n=1 Tax=Actinotalea subterranea TaxID=2607497 RepID=UPI001FE66866|nr:DEAD/DEAH box helicase [Actinotalea subterranea]